MSKATEPDMAGFRRAVDEFMDRAMAYGFSESEARRICKELCLKESDRIAREKRGQFKIVGR
jgi:hypothetical protein